MKRLFSFFLLAGSLQASLAQAQDASGNRRAPGLPLTITIFSESISLPTFRNLQKGGLGIRVGTELYYRNRPGSQVFQTLGLGFYRHPGVQSGLFMTTEVGYRKFVGPVFADATLGVGGLLLHPVAPSYVRDDATLQYRKASPWQLKAMPTLGLGAGVRFRNQSAVFARYELFGEMPFSHVILPHQALQVGTRLLF